MAEDKDKFEEIVDPDDVNEHKIIKTVNIQYDKRQYSIRIPIAMVRALGIKKGDKFTFEVDLEEDSKDNKGYFRLGDK